MACSVCSLHMETFLINKVNNNQLTQQKMKKLFLMMALAATALFTVTACGDDDDDNGGSSNNSGTVTLTPPPYKNEAKVLDLQDNTLRIKQLRIMENGTYMITAEKDYNSRETRAVDLTSMYVEYGKFSVVSSGVFKFSNGMTITIKQTSGNNYDVTIEWQGGTTIQTTGVLNTSNTVASGVMTDNLCSRSWKIEKLIIGGSINGTSVGKEFNSSSIKLADVKQWYLDKGGKLQDEFDATAIITGILFDSQGLFTIMYDDNHKPDVGTWHWSDMNAGKLAYSWNSSVQSISIFTGEATVSFEKSPEKCILTFGGKISGNDLKFIFHLV